METENASTLGLLILHEEVGYYFCSPECRDRFRLAPGFYSNQVHMADDEDSDRAWE